ncbi:GUN4 domain-containing protein [Nostoc sp. 'Lobaria pulmonaria (5183) cyanobiont']|uniref:GUN4 domain-containing protein n=1 Tax=Nostoc sp. 'Lobaria pulmonaria (5183) cyanobiont' TaxID=1618022 RepID=UPI000CF32507|nr:GUN4 domain-containing protein [Nostoc sp. 'Lobaria pulmonaria (5183) cyanobiont']AVH74225.1 GUN4 domain-containing protein [Nostoc sp. 'Lobaria pulmonaria (5183) cyanobiont']
MEQFDVFLCHNSQEKAQVEEIRTQLLQTGIYAWLDKYDFEPFRPWQDQLDEIIFQIKAAAVFIGSSGVGPWADIEMKEFLVEFAKRKIRMGLVILPGCPDHLINEVPRFMRSFQWVDFRHQDPDPMERLIWGITGIKPGTQTIIHPPVFERPSKPPETTPKPPHQTDDLSSEKGIDYTKLRDLLAAKNWKEADEETYRVMIQAVGKEEGDYFTNDELLNFPCTDLRTIDRLWVKYSNGHFGFSVQKEIYLSVGGKADGKYYEKVWEKFGDRVGWRVKRNFFVVSNWINYSDVIYDTASPRGHLPAGRSGIGFSVSSLASRLVNCNTP